MKTPQVSSKREEVDMGSGGPIHPSGECSNPALSCVCVCGGVEEVGGGGGENHTQARPPRLVCVCAG